MFALALRYLNGWAMAAADGAKKEQAEWPPHPDRAFMALAAAWFETGEDPAEGAALSWLEALDPPSIVASGAEYRHSLSDGMPLASYVPVNDSRMGRVTPKDGDLGKLKDAGLGLLPEYRSRQVRGFPVAIPHDPVVHMVWATPIPPEHKQALSELASKVTYVGHSASFVQAWVDEGPPMPTWEPSSGTTKIRLRVPSAGRLEALKQRCNLAAVREYGDLSAEMATLKGKEKAKKKAVIEERFGNTPPRSLRPLPGRWEGYDPASEPSLPDVPGTVFDPNLVVLTLAGRRMPVSATLRMTEALRGAILSACPQEPGSPIPEWLSGHTADGRPTQVPHVAFLPLPYVGSEHADGHVLGLALALPMGLAPQEAARCLGPFLYEEGTGLPKRSVLFDGKWMECGIEREMREKPPLSLRPSSWTCESRTWGTVTPITLDRHFDGADKWRRAGESIKLACTRIGLPRPTEVLLHPNSLVEAAPPAREFPALERKSDGGKRTHTHAVLIFDTPVRGPIIVGAGRFRGYGLCRPLDQGGPEHD